jgi:ubiquitin-protein ligase E3 C
MLGKAMYEGILVDLPMAGFVLKQVRGNRCDLNDLPTRDRQLHEGLRQLTRMSPTELAEMDLSFVIADSGGSEVPLMPSALLPSADA